MKFGTTEEVAVCSVLHGHSRNIKNPLGKCARSQNWHLYEILHFLVEAAHMFLGAGWTALPGRIGGGGGKDESLHLSVDLGGSRTVISSPRREGILGQILLSTDFLWPCAQQLPCYSMLHVIVFANPVFGMDNKTTYGHRNHIWLECLYAFYCCKAFITFGLNFGSAGMAALMSRYFNDSQRIFVY